MDADGKVVSGSGEEPADIGLHAEPKCSAVEEARNERFGHQEATAVAGGQGGRVVEEGPGVEDLEDFGVGVANDGQVPFGEGGEPLGELASARGVDPLEEPPVAAGGERHIVAIGEIRWPVATQDAQRQVLVDDDHDQTGPARSVVVVVAVTAEQPVGGQVGVEGGLELLDQVAGGHPAEQLLALGAEPGVSRPAPPAPFLEHFLTDAHHTILPGRAGDRALESPRRVVSSVTEP